MPINLERVRAAIDAEPGNRKAEVIAFLTSLKTEAAA